MKRSVLLTGFEPFDGERINPSWEAVRRLKGTRIAGHVIAVARLPTEFARAPLVLSRAIARHDPALVLCVGQAGGRPVISVERVAVNLADARIADNAGQQPTDAAVRPGAPDAYLAALPVKRLVGALLKAGIPAEMSMSAGTFVCNAVFFDLCHGLAADPDRGRRGGFVHIPYLPEQAATRPGTPSLPLETVIRALEICIRETLKV